MNLLITERLDMWGKRLRGCLVRRNRRHNIIIASKPEHSSGRRQAAFTLVEIMVMIVIMGIVAALVFPAVASSKQAANNAKCVSNLRQIGIALAAYAGDHDGVLFPGACLDDTGTYNWFQCLDMEYMGGSPTNQYSDTRPAWQLCPSKKFPDDPTYNKNNKWYLIGYGWNWYDAELGYLPSWPGYNPRLSQITRPTHTIVVGDSMDLESAPAFFQNMFIYPPRGDYVNSKYRAARHGGKGNYLMADWHVEALPPTMDAKYFRKIQ